MLDEYIERQSEKDRKRKQEYLIEHVISENYNPESFSEFLLSERPDGQNIDNWTIEELESEVALFKRSAGQKNKKDELAFKLESLELPNTDGKVYTRRLKTAKKKKTVLSNLDISVTIESVEVKDGGLFTGKYLNFTISIPQLNIRTLRSETDFRWLYDFLSREFPFTPLPPLIRPNEKQFDKASLSLTKQHFALFLNECATHPDLRHSLVLEIFLVSQTQEEMAQRGKDVQLFLEKSVLLDKALTKKGFDALNTDVLSLFPTAKGSVQLKVSSLLRNYVKASECQYRHFGVLFDRLEKLQGEADRYQRKLVTVNSQIKDTFIELQSVALKFNSSKPVRNLSNLIVDTVFASISTYYDNFGGLSRTDNREGPQSLQPVHHQLHPSHAGLHQRHKRTDRPAKLNKRRVPQAQVLPRRAEVQTAFRRENSLGDRPGAL